MFDILMILFGLMNIPGRNIEAYQNDVISLVIILIFYIMSYPPFQISQLSEACMSTDCEYQYINYS